MTNFLSEVGRSFLRAFAASILVLSTGVLAAPNLNEAYLLATAAILASVTAGLKAIQVFVPGFSWGKVFGNYGSIADSFTRALLGSLIVLIPGVYTAPDLSSAKALGTAAIVAAVTAGVRAIQGQFTKGDFPNP